MNKAFIIGNLTADPELRQTSSGISCTLFAVAVNRSFTNANGERDVDFINVQAWRSTAENCVKYLKKGSKVAIDGRLQVRNYEKDGEKRVACEIVAENVEFLSKPPEVVEDKKATGKALKKTEHTANEDDSIPF